MRRRGRWVFVAAGLLVQFALSIPGLPIPIHLRTVLSFLLLVIAPGAAWLTWFGLRPPGGKVLAAGWMFALGVAWNVALLALTSLVGVPFTVLVGVTPFTTFAIWSLALLSGRATDAPRPVPDLRGGARWWVIAAATFAALLCAWLGARLTLASDAPDHIGTLNRMLEHGQLFPSDAFYRAAGAAGVDPRKSLWHGVLALICAIAHVKPIDAWRDLPALLAPLFVLNVATLGALVADGAGAGIAAWTLVITCGASLADSGLRDAVYASRASDQLALAAAVAALSDLRQRSRASRALAAAMAAGAVAAHVFSTIHLAISLGAFMIAGALIDRGMSARIKRLIGTVAAMSVAAIPFALWQVLRSPPALNVIHTEPQGLLVLWGNQRVVSPGVVWDWFGPAWLLFPLLLVPLWRARRSSDGALFLLSTALGAGAVMFFPPLVALLQPRLGYLLMRVAWVLPLAGWAAWGMPHVARLAARRRGIARLAALSLLAACLLTLAPAAVDAIRVPFEWPRLAASEHPLTPLPWQSDLELAESALEPACVVLADPVTSYSVPMLTHAYVVTMLDQHGPPSDGQAMRRLLDSRDALDPYADWGRLRDVASRYGVDAIVLNNRFREIPPADFWAPQPSWFAAERARLDAHPAAFEPVVARDDFVVYRLHAAALDSLHSPPPPRPYVAGIAAGDQPIGHRTGPGLPDFLRLRMSSAVARPGDSLRAGIDWRGAGVGEGGSYQVTVRFDRPLPQGFEPPGFLGKPARKLLERATGRLYRFRADHLPVAGGYGVDLWERNQVVQDSFPLVVPRNVASGIWQVSVLMTRHPHYPNLRLSDYFFDHDYLAGVPAGELEILPAGAAGRASDDAREGRHVRH